MINYKIRITRILTSLFLLFLLSGSLSAQTNSYEDTLRRVKSSSFAEHFIHRIGVEGRIGYIFPTNPFMKGSNNGLEDLRTSFSGQLKYSFQVRPHTVADRAYTGAYQGLGIGYFDFGNRKELGNPLALYLFQGGRIVRFSPRLSLNYEWNFGISLGWKPYSSITNPNNLVMGSKANAYLDTSFYLNWILSPKFDFVLGAAGNHFSNGNTRYPNSGLNTIECKIGLIYHFNRTKEDLERSWQEVLVPSFPQHISYDLTLFGSWRKKAVFVPEGQIPAPGTYAVAGFSFAPMYNIGYKFRAGISLDGIYDHSANIKSLPDEEYAFTVPSFNKQIALGLAARGEYVMPYFTIGIGLGRNILHAGGDLKSFYQILALKIDVSRNSYLHIGYNLRDFHEPNYLMLGIGYRFNNKRPKLF